MTTTRKDIITIEEVEFPKNTQAFDIVLPFADEKPTLCHEYHRSLRKANLQVHSILEDVQGRRPARRKGN